MITVDAMRPSAPFAVNFTTRAPVIIAINDAMQKNCMTTAKCTIDFVEQTSNLDGVLNDSPEPCKPPWRWVEYITINMESPVSLQFHE